MDDIIYINDLLVDCVNFTAQVTDHIAEFTSRTFSSRVEYRVVGATTYDTVTFQ